MIVIVNSKIDFDSLYTKIKNIVPIKSKISYYQYPYKYIVDIQNEKNNEKLSESISKMSNLKFISSEDSTRHKYKLFSIELGRYMNRKGKFEIENLKTDFVERRQKCLEKMGKTKF